MVVRPEVRENEGVEAFYSLTIRSLSSFELVPLGCKLPVCFLVLPSYLGETGWLEKAGVGYFPSPVKLGSDKTPRG